MRSTIDLTPIPGLTVREDIVLRFLGRRGADGARYPELGGWPGSWHQKALASLIKRGYVERRERAISKPHWRRYEYRITSNGRRYLERRAVPRRGPRRA